MCKKIEELESDTPVYQIVTQAIYEAVENNTLPAIELLNFVDPGRVFQFQPEDFQSLILYATIRKLPSLLRVTQRFRYAINNKKMWDAQESCKLIYTVDLAMEQVYDYLELPHKLKQHYLRVIMKKIKSKLKGDQDTCDDEFPERHWKLVHQSIKDLQRIIPFLDRCQIPKGAIQKATFFQRKYIYTYLGLSRLKDSLIQKERKKIQMEVKERENQLPANKVKKHLEKLSILTQPKLKQGAKACKNCETKLELGLRFIGRFK